MTERCLANWGRFTRRKQSIRTNTYKLLAKARENIEATEGGMFGIGHQMNAEVKLKNEI